MRLIRGGEFGHGFSRMEAQYPDAAELSRRDTDKNRQAVANFLRTKLPVRANIAQHIAPVDNGEPMVEVVPHLVGKRGVLAVVQHNTSMYGVTGGKLYGRAGLVDKLEQFAGVLGENAPLVSGRDRSRQLLVTYTYRPKHVQEESNARIKKEILSDPNFHGSDEELLDRMHIRSAQVEIAGHPTGGAADVASMNWHGELMDLGVKWKNLSESASVEDTELFYWPFITKEQADARDELKGAAAAVGLFWFDGESAHVDSSLTPEGAYREQLCRDKAAGTVGPLVVAQYKPIEFNSPADVAALQWT